MTRRSGRPQRAFPQLALRRDVPRAPVRGPRLRLGRREPGAIPEAVRHSAELYAGCVAGAIDEADYVSGPGSAGFEGVEVRTSRAVAIPDAALGGVLGAAETAAFRASGCEA